MRLEELGWDADFRGHFLNTENNGCVPARVSGESKGFYKVLAEEGEFLAQVAGRLRHGAGGRCEFPSVGDWVVVAPRLSEGQATIVAILPRRTVLSRKMAGRVMAEQILATNLDTIFVVTALGPEVRLRRIERYLALSRQSGAQVVVLLNKSDLRLDLDNVSAEVACVALGAPVHSLSAATGAGLESLKQYLERGRTAAFIGPSGAGKSSIINALVGARVQAVRSVRSSDQRGRHTTTSRQMIVLAMGGVVVDSPGNRELQLWDNDAGLAEAFADLVVLAEGCRFRDCQHRAEPGCAVARAIERGLLERERFDNYRKMQAELRFLESKTDPRARQREKERVRQMCKLQKKGPKKG